MSIKKLLEKKMPINTEESAGQFHLPAPKSLQIYSYAHLKQSKSEFKLLNKELSQLISELHLPN
jgi:hypothetical protein